MQSIFHLKEPRDLAAAVSFYCGREHAGAHSALADAMACWEILQAQVKRYDDLPATVGGLAKLSAFRSGEYFDSGGWFVPRDGQPVFARGKHQGRLLREVAREEPAYLDWMLDQANLASDTKRLVKKGRRPPHRHRTRGRL